MVRVTTLAMALATIVAASAMATAAAGDQETLQGTWQVVEARARIADAAATSLSAAAWHGTIAFAGGNMTMRNVGGTRDSSYAFTFTLDTSTSPRHIDLTAQGSAQGDRWAGIYRMTRDSLWLSLPIEHYSDRPVRPIDFGASNTIALILKRAPR